MKLIQKFIVIILAILLLLSYYMYIPSGNYMTHPLWFNLDINIVYILTIFQIMALCGFLISVGYWLYFSAPMGGIMSKNNNLFYTLCLFLIFSTTWTISLYYKKHELVVISLVGVAIASILLLAGSVEETKPKWFVVLGLIFLCITTVLGDGIIWNSNYISKLLYSKDKDYEKIHPASI